MFRSRTSPAPAPSTDNNSYGGPWSRTRRLAVPPFLARQQPSPTPTPNNPTTAGGRVVPPISIADIIHNANAQAMTTANDGSKNKVETLFGPPVGVGGNPAPEWTNSWAGEHTNSAGDKEDELTPEIVKEWIRRSKEETNDVVPTTTLQALVNLKRPSIKLTPLLSITAPEETPSTHPTHGIEFEYDCDAARCSISVHALVPLPSGAHPADGSKLSRTVLFNQCFDGGFGRHLRLDDEAFLELAKLDTSANANASAGTTPLTPPTDTKELAVTTENRPDTGSTLVSPRPLTGASSTTAVSNATPSPHLNNKKRFSAFHFRRRTLPPNAVGPSLQVVDTDAAEPALHEDGDDAALALTPATAGGAASHGGKLKADADEGGVKVMIRLEALDEDDKPLPARNAQMTYLHIVQVGSNGTVTAHSNSDPPPSPPMTPPAPAAMDEEAAIGPSTSTQTQTHWVVKVVKREALLGPHVFRLQEIYGLASSSSTTTQPESTPMTYPPTASGDAGLGHGGATECVLCLSSPREVVLLPCRHLVACRECAVNMVEFGAGGQLTHEQGPDATANPTGAGEGAGDASASAGGEGAAAGEVAAPAVAVATTATERRRKRKAKGWFCPVCRQPYTALLRITTTPPGKRLSEDSFSHPPILTSAVGTGGGDGDPLNATTGEVPPVTTTTTGPVDPSTTPAAPAPPEAAHTHTRSIRSGGGLSTSSAGSGGGSRFGGTLFSGLRAGRNSTSTERGAAAV